MIQASEIELSPYPTVLAFDPGGTTGWCIMMVHPAALADPEISILDNIQYWEQGQIEGDEISQAVEMCEMMDCWDSASLLVEDFILRKFSSGRELLSPVRLTAMLSFHASVNYDPPRNMFLQQSEIAMSTATDDRLRAWGLYKREGGEEHARDACRHVITYLRRAKDNVKLREKAWPDIYVPEGVVHELAAVL